MEVDGKYEPIIQVLEENDQEIQFKMSETGKTFDQVVHDALAVYGLCINV